jgi:hypothetical protein
MEAKRERTIDHLVLQPQFAGLSVGRKKRGSKDEVTEVRLNPGLAAVHRG